ncbi:fatty acid desaturase family protein, partial [Georgenia alba]
YRIIAAEATAFLDECAHRTDTAWTEPVPSVARLGLSALDGLVLRWLVDRDSDVIGRELDEIRRDVEDSRGERDARYIRNVIRLQRVLEVGGRLTLFGSKYRPAWFAGTTMLALAKCIENMELGHNVVHGQWDWMNDPEVHSSTWEWDVVGPSAHWKQTHNYLHHKYTNILGMDDDVGYGLLRVTRDQRWKPFN